MDSAPKTRPEEAPIRLLISCDMCRQRKVKCDGSKPSCGRCIRMGVNCHYSPITERRRSRKSQTPSIQAYELQKENSMLSEALEVHQEVSDLLSRLRELTVQLTLPHQNTHTRDENSKRAFREETNSLSTISEDGFPRIEDDSSTQYSIKNSFDPLLYMGKTKCEELVTRFFKHYCPLITGLEQKERHENYFLSQINEKNSTPFLLSIISAGSIIDSKIDSTELSSHKNEDLSTAYSGINTCISDVIQKDSVESLATLNILGMMSLKTGKNLHYSSLAVRMGMRMGLGNSNIDKPSTITHLFWSSVLVDSLVTWQFGEPPSVPYEYLDLSGSSYFGQLSAIIYKVGKRAYMNSIGSTESLSVSTQHTTQILRELDICSSSKNDFPESFIDEDSGFLSAKMFFNILYHSLTIATYQNYSLNVWKAQHPIIPQTQGALVPLTVDCSVQPQSLISAGKITQILAQYQNLETSYHIPGISRCVFLSGLVYIESIVSLKPGSTDAMINATYLVEHIKFLENIGEQSLARVLSSQMQQAVEIKHKQLLNLSTLINPVSASPRISLMSTSFSANDLRPSIPSSSQGANFDQFINAFKYSNQQIDVAMSEQDIESYFSQVSAAVSEKSSTIISQNTNKQQINYNDYSSYPLSGSGDINDAIASAFSNST
ncbi:hypothetical protein BB558_000918 [Smittium angustum]|uniref:Zn(2)-C6 fungal-type domain-containing protein n=1 Tax=Smittium angustum TaxID=133377 RepID=A0A2U1JD69_SMIAN|nr:hypothetical protein BB558_000918 [Smittium angustum]